MGASVSQIMQVFCFEHVICFPRSLLYGMVFMDNLFWETPWSLGWILVPCLAGVGLSVNLCINRVSANKNVAELCYSIVQIMI